MTDVLTVHVSPLHLRMVTEAESHTLLKQTDLPCLQSLDYGNKRLAWLLPTKPV